MNIKHIGHLIVLMIVLSHVPLAQAAMTVDFFAVGHQDDWQLFMNPNVYRSIKNTSSKTVFLHLTAGDAGAGGETGTQYPYYKAREEGALRAIRFLVNIDTKKGGLHPKPKKMVFNQHQIERYQYHHTVAYFLRIPDGNYYSYGHGYPETNYESIKNLYSGKPATSIDKSTIYQDWNDLVSTLQDIVKWEAKNSETIQFHLSESDRQKNPADHPDHQYASQAMQDVAKRMGCVSQYFYIHYESHRKPANVTGTELFVNIGTWGATTSGLADYQAESTWDAGHNVYLNRQYVRQINHECSRQSLMTPTDNQ